MSSQPKQISKLPLRQRLTTLHLASPAETADSPINEEDIEFYLTCLNESPPFHEPEPLPKLEFNGMFLY